MNAGVEVLAVVDRAIADVEENFRPCDGFLVERNYGSRAAYIDALERQVVEDREAVSSAPEDAPDSWRSTRLVNTARCETKARLERAALARVGAS